MEADGPHVDIDRIAGLQVKGPGTLKRDVIKIFGEKTLRSRPAPEYSYASQQH
jgi:hypothetical protein